MISLLAVNNSCCYLISLATSAPEHHNIFVQEISTRKETSIGVNLYHYLYVVQSPALITHKHTQYIILGYKDSLPISCPEKQ